MKVRFATEEALARKRATLQLLMNLLAAYPISREDYASLIEKANRDVRTIYLLKRRLRRKRFRIKWWNVIAVLGASALLVWYIVILLESV